MKIIYFLKKGFQYFPPCLSQVLYLNDLGIEFEIYHGKNSSFINQLFDKREIKHHTLSYDKWSKNRFDRIINFVMSSRELKKIQNEIVTSDDTIFWFGNLETAMCMSSEKLKSQNFILNVLELNNKKSLQGKYLKKMASYANLLICCEKHRSAIMRSWYALNVYPIVMPNKPYELYENIELDIKYKKILEQLKGKFIILYQGIISRDRPLEDISRALCRINDANIVFVFMGHCSEQKDKSYVEYIKSIYEQTYYLGFIPAPQHLAVTEYCQVGIANYDFSNLNNVFCAPNKIYEYAKFEKPILASQNLGLTETVGAFGAAECVDFKDTNALVKAILKIRNNYDCYRQSAREFYKSTDYRQLMQQVLSRITLTEKQKSITGGQNVNLPLPVEFYLRSSCRVSSYRWEAAA